jgi:hypothetical protein
MNIVELLNEVEKRGRFLVVTTERKLMFPMKEGYPRTPWSESLWVCARRHKSALVDIAIQQGAVYVCTKENGVAHFRKLSSVELEEFIDRD